MLGSSVFTNDADTIYRYDTDIQRWMGHPKFLPTTMDDFTLEMGDGYMIYVVENQVQYTITGTTGTAIRYMDGAVGGESGFRNNLTADVQGNQVVLRWEQATSATGGYAIYRGTARIGNNSLSDFKLEPIATVTTTSWVDTGATGIEYYYMVVALDGLKEGSSTYAVGVKRYSFSSGYSMISFELEPTSDLSAAGFTTNMFSADSSTVYHYDRSIGTWRGHPRFLPETVDNFDIDIGKAYIVYVHAEDGSYAITGM
jgi:hypothetical protein